MVFRRMLPLLLTAALLSGCVFGGDGGGGMIPAAGPVRPRPGPAVRVAAPVSEDTQACFTDLVRQHVRYNPLPDTDHGGGCTVLGAVQLLDVGVPVSGITAMRCPLADNFASWVRYAVAPAAHQILGSDLVKIESLGTYACRGIVGRGSAGAQKLSEHAFANAVDVAAFVLADGRKVTIEQGWNSADPEVREFLQVIHKSACRRFETVLSPDYNAAHYNHLHLDMGRGPFCA